MIKKKTLNKLQEFTNQPCVSIYAPMEVAGDYEKNRLVWKNACNKALDKLSEKEEDAKAILQPAFDLIEDAEFWAYQTKCLAGFYTKGFNQTFSLSNGVNDLVSVFNDFYLAPMLRELSGHERVFVLALSKNETRFFEAVSDGIYPVYIHDVVVKNMDEAFNNIENPSQSIQFRTVGGGRATFHGNGLGTQENDDRTKQYLKRVDDGLMEIISDETVPLVIAGVEEYYPMYKEVTKYNHLSDHMVTGNPENLSPQEIREQIEPVFTAMRSRAVNNFDERFQNSFSGGLAIKDNSDILAAAKHKNIDQLLVSQEFLDTLNADEMEKIDDAVMQVFNSGGDIIITPLHHPDLGFAAIKRWA